MDNKQQLKKKIKQTELQLKQLDFHASNSDVCNDLYNSLILKKAVFKKELELLNRNPLIERIKRIIPRRKKLICDYFKG